VRATASPSWAGTVISTLELYQAVLAAGMELVPLNPGHAVAELRYALGDSGARMLFSASGADGLDDVAEDIIDLDAGYEALLAAGPDEERFADDDTAGLAGRFYTGGTTGAAMGVMLTHCNLIANGTHLQACWRCSIRWSGYRARTICEERVVYFDSTSLLPAHQGHGLIPSLQRAALEREHAAGEPRPTSLAVRTCNPAAHRLAIVTQRTEPVIPSLDGTVPTARRRLVAETARSLNQHPFDPTTSRAIGAYGDGPSLHGQAALPR